MYGVADKPQRMAILKFPVLGGGWLDVNRIDTDGQLPGSLGERVGL